MKIRKFGSLSFRLTLWYILIMGVLIALAGAFLFQGMKRELWEDVDRSLWEIANDVNNIWKQAYGVTWADALREAEKKYKEIQPLIQVVKLSRYAEDFPEEVIRSANVTGDSFMLRRELYYRAEQSEVENHLFLTLPYQARDSYDLRIILLDVRGPYVIQVGISLEHTAGQLRRLTIVLVLAGLLLLLFASFGGYLIIRRALKPVQRVVQAARQITTDDLSLRIDSGGRRDEIGALVETFNQMIARLEKSVDRIKQFSGDVSHELRTPLTVIRGEIEVLLRKDREKREYIETLNSILEESKGMGRIIEDLLFLSRIDVAKKIGIGEDLDLSELVAKACESRRSQFGEKGISFSMEISPSLRLKGDRTLLERMVLNIIDNAIRYTPDGGRVDLTLKQEEGQALLRVSDTGIGIPEEALPYIFDRFFVVDHSRSKESGGVGLGLAIAKSVADMHGAAIEVQSRLGEGSTFSVRIQM